MMALDPAWIALIGTVCGGVGLKAIDHYLGRSKIKTDDASRIRDELRIEITNQREEILKLEAERDKWREDYYTLRDEFSRLQTQLTLALKNIMLEAEQQAADAKQSKSPEQAGK